jgi:hypothetical protein
VQQLYVPRALNVWPSVVDKDGVRRLEAQQRVAVILDDEDDELACMVAWVKGSVATLVCPGEVAPPSRAKLTASSLGFLMFEHRGSPVALRGEARADADSPILEFVVVDGVQVPERRITNRLSLVIPVRVNIHEDSAAELIETTSADLSITGVLLERRPGLGDGPRWKIELVLPGNVPPICCDAVVARQTRTHIGVKFIEMDPADHARLDEILEEHHSAVRSAA